MRRKASVQCCWPQRQLTRPADVAVAKLREENQNVSSLLEKERLALKETQKAAQEAKVKLEDAGAAAREAAKRLEAAQHEAWVQHSRCLALEGELGATRGGSTGGSRRHLDVQAEQLRQLKIAAACSGNAVRWRRFLSTYGRRRPFCSMQRSLQEHCAHDVLPYLLPRVHQRVGGQSQPQVPALRQAL